jgi:transglutaminase-like putative cysteine protease
VSVLDIELNITPEAEVSWIQDVFGNAVVVATFEEPSDKLTIGSRVLIERYSDDSPPIPMAVGARHLPVLYPESEFMDLYPTRQCRHPEDGAALQAWLHEFLTAADNQTWPVLEALNRAIRHRFEYRVRLEHGVQTPAETLRFGSGTCRDFALLMMEAARSLGLAARFVSGYLYDPAHEPDLHGAGHTHAWAQIYLPGPGWVEFDPTNALIDGRNLIRVAVARDPVQAVPVQGAFIGPPDAGLGMDVSVRVEAQPQPPEQQPEQQQQQQQPSESTKST